MTCIRCLKNHRRKRSGFVARPGCRADCPFPLTDLSYEFRDGDSECGITVEHGDADPELGDLSLEIPRHEALPQ